MSSFFLVHTSTSYNSLTVIFVVTCTFELSETCLPDEWIGVNKKKTTNICTDSQGSKFRKLRACSTPTTQKVWLRMTMEKEVHNCQGSWGSKLWACRVANMIFEGVGVFWICKIENVQTRHKVILIHIYSLTSRYRHLYNRGTSLLRTVRLVPEKPKLIHSLPL